MKKCQKWSRNDEFWSKNEYPKISSSFGQHALKSALTPLYLHCLPFLCVCVCGGYVKCALPSLCISTATRNGDYHSNFDCLTIR